MTTFLPYRAQVYCNLGHLISGNFADTYLQQAGLIFCRGSIELAGLYQPAIGAPVEFAYTRSPGSSGTAARLPRKLLVLASFADPLRNVTSVQIGCRLSLMRNKRDTVKRIKPEDSYKDETGDDLPAGTTNYVSPPISANYIAARCLVETGITATGLLPLSNQYTIDEFDFTNGYVDILGTLLQSEMIVGRMNDDDKLETFSLLNVASTAGPVINDTNCFTLSPNGPGELPAEQVVTVYDPVPFKNAKIVIPPLDPVTGEPVSGEEVIDPGDPGGPLDPGVEGGVGGNGEFQGKLDTKGGWSRSVTYGAPVTYRIEYTAGGSRGTYVGEYTPVQSTVSTFSEGLLVKSVTSTVRPYAAVAGKYASQALSNGLPVPLDKVAATTETVNNYETGGRLLSSIVTSYISLAEFAGRLDLTYAFSNSDFVKISADGSVIAERTVTTYQYNDLSVKRSTSRYVNWALSQSGQQAVSAGRESFTTSGEVAEFVNSVIGAPAYEGTETTISDAGPQEQRLPNPAQLTRQVYGEEPEGEEDASDTVTTDFQLGAVESQTAIEFRLPLTPTSYFEEVDNGEWEAVNEKRKAASLAYEYGKVQNRLLLGNVKGASMQIPVELMPVKPFDPVYLQIGGLTGQYRANGMSYTFNRDGIVGQIDALFWEATGQTGTPGPLWFPVPPAVTVLPAAPTPTVNGSPAAGNSAALPSGWDPAAPDLVALFGALPVGAAPVYPVELDAPTGLVPFNEAVNVDAVSRSVFEVQEFPYSLAPQEEDVDLVSRSVFEVQEVVTITPPAAAFALVPQVPFVYAPALVSAPVAEFAFLPQVPTVTGAAFVSAPRARFRLVPQVPVVGSQGRVDAPVLTFRLVPQVPNVTAPVPKFELRFEGANGGTTFTDTGSSGATVTANNGAVTSTASFAEGSSSGLFTRSSGSYLQASSISALDFGTGYFKIVFRARFNVLPSAVPGVYTVIRGVNSGSLEIRFTSANAIGIVRPGVGNDYDTAPLSISIDTWYLFEIERIGSSITFKQDGTLLETGTGLSASYNLSSGGTYVGGNAGSTNFDGYLDWLLIE